MAHHAVRRSIRTTTVCLGTVLAVMLVAPSRYASAGDLHPCDLSVADVARIECRGLASLAPGRDPQRFGASCDGPEMAGPYPVPATLPAVVRVATHRGDRSMRDGEMDGEMSVPKALDQWREA